MTRAERIRTSLCLTMVGLLACAAVGYRLQMPEHPNWVYEARAGASDRPQVILFRHEVVGGQRVDRDDPYLPPILDEEARYGRLINYDRCRVAIDANLASGRVLRVGYDDPKTLFTVQVNADRWEADESLLEDLACLFAAGDVRRTVVFPVLDGEGRQIGVWRHGRYLTMH